MQPVMGCGRYNEKMNVQHRTPNTECLKGKDEDKDVRWLKE
jgi:hypothetical protein